MPPNIDARTLRCTVSKNLLPIENDIQQAVLFAQVSADHPRQAGSMYHVSPYPNQEWPKSALTNLRHAQRTLSLADFPRSASLYFGKCLREWRRPSSS